MGGRGRAQNMLGMCGSLGLSFPTVVLPVAVPGSVGLHRLLSGCALHSLVCANTVQVSLPLYSAGVLSFINSFLYPELNRAFENISALGNRIGNKFGAL